MISFAAIQLPSRKVYIPIEHATFFSAHPKSDWNVAKNDVWCPEHNVSFHSVTALSPKVIKDSVVYYEGIQHPVLHLVTSFEDIELNRDY